jgi:hypothetical protein
MNEATNDEAYIEWYEAQPEEFVHRVWSEGYAEGRMQEKNNIVDFPELIAEKPNLKFIEDKDV